MSTNSTSTPSILDILLKLIEEALVILQKARPILQQLRSNEQVLQLLQLAQVGYSKLPESVSLALTISAIFLSSLVVFRVGRSLLGFLVALIQIVIVLVVSVVVWKLRDPLGAWLEQVLNQ